MAARRLRKSDAVNAARTNAHLNGTDDFSLSSGERAGVRADSNLTCPEFSTTKEARNKAGFQHS